MTDHWLTVDEVAEYLGVAKDTIYAWVSHKGMPGHQVERFWKIKNEDMDASVRAGRAAASSEDIHEKGESA